MTTCFWAVLQERARAMCMDVWVSVVGSELWKWRQMRWKSWTVMALTRALHNTCPFRYMPRKNNSKWEEWWEKCWQCKCMKYWFKIKKQANTQSRTISTVTVIPAKQECWYSLRNMTWAFTQWIFDYWGKTQPYKLSDALSHLKIS